MLRTVKELLGFSVGASDGEIGEIRDIYFDDERWVVRYMVVNPGGWLSGRKVLISPISVRNVDWDDEVVNVNLDQRQIRESPSIDTDKPVSRQHETDYYRYFGYPSYWEGANLWGLGAYPMPWVGASGEVTPPSPHTSDHAPMRADQHRDSADTHLRSSKEVIGYEIMATDGPIGNVENFVFDEKSWAIRYFVVDTRKWWPGKRVLLSPEWIDTVSWPEREVYVKVARRAVETSPEYDDLHPLSREDETAVYRHHGRAVYWE